ncbi:hypothetical protein LR090_00515 [Candidatus Bipolaricaulota bacterium]|nr:hypothetical protein [Candidatus Bipolaricaulota bacterium]
MKLYDGNLIDAAPGRLWQLLFGTHPTGIQRVRLARLWKRTRETHPPPS